MPGGPLSTMSLGTSPQATGNAPRERTFANDPFSGDAAAVADPTAGGVDAHPGELAQPSPLPGPTGCGDKPSHRRRRLTGLLERAAQLALHAA